MQIQNPFDLKLPASLAGGGLVMPWQGHQPVIAEDVFIAPTAAIIGRTTLGEKASVWFGAILRGDVDEVRVGAGTNIQDNCVLHVAEEQPCIVGDRVVVGHLAMLHACTVEDDCLIGMSAIILDRAVIGRGSVVGAGALVTQDTIIPPNSLVLGSPAKVVRKLTAEESKYHTRYATRYVSLIDDYRPLFQTPNPSEEMD